MSETALRKYGSGMIKGHVVQLESHATANGVPDTNAHVMTRDVWIEMKFTRGNKKFEVRPSQKTWFRRRAVAGAKNLFILWRREVDGKNTHGIIHMAGERIEAVFRDPSPSFWAYASARTWSERIDETQLNLILKGK